MNSFNQMKPVTVYNCGLDKARLLKENRDRAAVYRLAFRPALGWSGLGRRLNKCNNKTYIGSTINCTNRFYKYFNLKHLAEKRTPIHLALLKYGFENFTLEILEYCEEGVNPITREQYYFSKLNPPFGPGLGPVPRPRGNIIF